MKNPKKWPAIIAAFLITGAIAFGMVLIGANALFNPNTTAIASAPGTAIDPTAATGNDPQSPQIQQMKDLLSQYQQRIQEYQNREKQYQTQLQQAEQQAQQAQQQLQQVSQQSQQAIQLIQALQQAGIIQIDSNGQVYLRNRFSDDH